MAPSTRSNAEGGGSSSDAIATQLAAIAARLEAMESLRDDVATLKQHAERSTGGYGRYEEAESSRHWGRQQRPFNKIEFPSYSEGNPRGWILKAQKYFRYYNIPDEEKVDVASMHLEGSALDLFSWLTADHEMAYWEELVLALQKNFGPAEFQNPDEYLCSVKQSGTVQEYHQEFAKRSLRVAGWPDHYLLGVFLNGLRDELKADVRIHKPRTVYKAMSIGMEYESKLTHSRTMRSYAGNPMSKQGPAEIRSVHPPSLPTSNAPKPYNRLSDTEKQTRFLRGECYRCGDKYGPGHRCKTGTLKILEVKEEHDGEEGEEHSPRAAASDEAAEISLHAILGKFNPTTMKVQGKLDSHEVLILIDGGSTHNFISDILVNELKLNTK